MAAFPPTAQQSAFLTALVTTTSHLALVARAGCGKTSTILMAVDAIRKAEPFAEVAVVAYNKAIATEVSDKLKAAGHTDWRLTQASTAHALGNGLLRFAYKSEINADKCRDIVRSLAVVGRPLLPGEVITSDNTYARYEKSILQLVAYGKQAAVGFFGSIADVSVWRDLADHYGMDDVDPEELDVVIGCAQHVYRISLDDTSVIDFDDMILLPLVKQLRVKFAKDYVFVDEAQDLSPARQAFIRKFVKPRTGRMIIVGDDRQAIYGFSGADADALPNMIRDLDATVLPLSVTWRCPQAVVREAQRYVPDIMWANIAPEGLVEGYANLFLAERPQSPALTFEGVHGLPRPGYDAILCRNTAPLITLAYSLIRQGIPAKVEGRAIGEGLKALAQRWKVRDCSALLNRLEAYETREAAKLQAKGRDDAIEALHDKVETLREIIRACQARGEQLVTDVLAAIDRLFGDDVKDAVTLATYHRSKGREWPRVILWEHASRCPSKAARQPWQRAQEDNLAYVAITRAMEVLAYVG